MGQTYNCEIWRMRGKGSGRHFSQHIAKGVLLGFLTRYWHGVFFIRIRYTKFDCYAYNGRFVSPKYTDFYDT